MQINREKFLASLMMVKSGLSSREFLEQSSCFCFADGQVMTFNDEVACRIDMELPITGAVQAVSLLAILEKMDDEVLDVEENEKGELEFRGKRRRFGVTKDAEVYLPIDRVKMPKHWHDIPAGVIEAIGLVHHCVSRDESRFTLTCIHLGVGFIEACDNFQAMRVHVKTGLPPESNVLVRGTSLAAMVSKPEEGVTTGLGMNQFGMTNSWLHFRNPQGLVFSCRRYVEDYPVLDKLITVAGHKITIPKGLKEACDRAAVFAIDKANDPLVSVRIAEGKLKIRGEGLSGWYSETKSTAYKGPPVEFNIAPDLLYHISDAYSAAEITPQRLAVKGADAAGRSWIYCTVLARQVPAEKE